MQLEIGDLFSDFALPDSEIHNSQMGILSPTVDLISPIGDNMAWIFSVSCLLEN